MVVSSNVPFVVYLKGVMLGYSLAEHGGMSTPWQAKMVIRERISLMSMVVGLYSIINIKLIRIIKILS